MGKRKEKPIERVPLADSEKETHLNMSAEDREVWFVYTDDEKMVALFDRIAAEKTARGFGYTYKLDSSKLVFAKPEKVAKVSVKGSRKAKQTFGIFFVSPSVWNATAEERELIATVDFVNDPMDFEHITNLKQLRASIKPFGDKKRDQKMHRLTLEVYRKFIEQRKKERSK